MRSIPATAIAGVALAVVLGCASSAPQRPAWIGGNPAQYSAQRYLTGIGQADNSAVARDRARADLAKVFRVTITEESRDVLRFDSTTSGKEQVARTEESIGRAITARTEQAVEGVRIAEMWTDPESRSVHALAVLDRLQAASRLRRAVEDLDRETRASIEVARSSEDLLGRLSAARRAITAQVERQELERMLNTVEVAGTGPRAGYSLQGLRADYDDLASRVRIAVAAEGDPAGRLRAALESAVATAGFTPGPEADASHRVVASQDRSEQVGQDGWHWVRGYLEVRVFGAGGSPLLGSHRWPLKVSARDPEDARRRADAQVQDLLGRDLQTVLLGLSASER